MAPGVDNPGQRGRERQGQAESYPGTGPACSLRWRGHVGESDTMGLRRGDEFLVGDRGGVGKETVAATGNGLDEAGIFRRVAQRFANLVDGFVEAVIEVDDRLAPKFLLQLFP